MRAWVLTPAPGGEGTSISPPPPSPALTITSHKYLQMLSIIAVWLRMTACSSALFLHPYMRGPECMERCTASRCFASLPLAC